MRHRRRHPRGTIIAFMLLIVAVLTTSILTSMALSTGTQSQIAGITLKRDQAFYTAEAGLQRALWLYTQDHSWRASAAAPLTGTLTQGSNSFTYSVTCVDAGANTVRMVSTVSSSTSPAASQVAAVVTGGGNAPGLAVGNNLADSGTLTVTGDVQAKGSVTRSGTMTLNTIAGGTPSDLQAMGSFTSSGTFSLPGDLQFNGSISSSGHVNVTGTAQAGAAITHSGQWNVAGGTNAWLSPNLDIHTPTVDTATLIAQAQADGTVITGGNKSNLTIDFTHGSNHVVLISSNVNISGNTTIIGTGTLIVQGTLSLSGALGTVPNPVVMNLVTTSDASMSGTFNIQGAVCIGGSYNKSGQTNITGVVVVQSDLNGSGNVSIQYAQPPSFVKFSGTGGTGTAAVVGNFTGPIY